MHQHDNSSSVATVTGDPGHGSFACAATFATRDFTIMYDSASSCSVSTISSWYLDKPFRTRYRMMARSSSLFCLLTSCCLTYFLLYRKTEMYFLVIIYVEYNKGSKPVMCFLYNKQAISWLFHYLLSYPHATAC